MAEATVTERIKILECEIKDLQGKIKEDFHWRKILEEWLLNRFGFDVNIELKKKPLSNFFPEGKGESKKEPNNEEPVDSVLIQDDDMLLPEEANTVDNTSESPNENTSTNDTEGECKKISSEVIAEKSAEISSSRLLGSNVNIVIVDAKKIAALGTSQDKEISTTSKTTINILAENIEEVKTEKSKVAISENAQIPENTEYHVTLKAKNAIKKLEDRENGYECKECKQIFDNLYKAEGHARHHFETKFKCIDCPLYFEVEQDLILHAQVVHYKIKKRLNTFTCYIGGCPWTSKSPEALRHHRTLKHSESTTPGNTQENPVQSVTPADSSKDEAELKVDDAEAGDAVAPKASSSVKVESKPDEQLPRKAEVDDLISYKGRNNGENSQWQCKVCEKTFSELTLAKVHVVKTHSTLHFPSNERKGRHVVCKVCKKAFSNDNWLKRHELAEHRSRVKKYAVL